MALINAKVGSKAYTCKLDVYSINDKCSRFRSGCFRQDGRKLIKVFTTAPLPVKLVFLYSNEIIPQSLNHIMERTKITEVQIKPSYSLNP